MTETPSENKLMPVRITVGQVWMDTEGKLGVVICEAPDGYGLQVGDYMTQVIPTEHVKLFWTNAEWLGEL